MFQPENLKIARQRRALKKSALATRADVSLQSITAYEQGKTEPRPATVTALAKALEIPVAFLHDGAMAEPISLDGASFRSLSKMTAGQRDSALAAGAFCARLTEWIDERFEMAEPDIPDLEPDLIDPVGAAALLRARWGLGNLPVGNLLHLVESHGVRVYSLAIDCREVDAFSFWSGDTPIVCLGTHKTPERAVFDLAHEVAHLVLHRGQRDPRGRSEEREANEFASNFLMPAEDVRAHAPRFPSFEDLVRAKIRWRISVAALNYRMHDLGLTTDWHYRELCIEISQAGREKEPNSLRRDQSYILTHMLSVMRSEGVSRSDIARQLNFSRRDFDRLLNGLVVGAVDDDNASGGDNGPSGKPPKLTLVRD